VTEVPLGLEGLLSEMERGHPVRQRQSPLRCKRNITAVVGSRCALCGQAVRAPTGCRFTDPISVSPPGG
jgi:hypothetical protein